MSTGLILLVLIGAIVAFGWTRLRGKMKLSVSGKHWVGPVVIVGLVLLLMWSSSVQAATRADRRCGAFRTRPPCPPAWAWNPTG